MSSNATHFYGRPTPVHVNAPTKFNIIVDRIRRANIRYGTFALTMSRYYHQNRTHSAQWRAYKLGLWIDINKAKNCPQKAVSVDPLPIIEVVEVDEPSPFTPDFVDEDEDDSRCEWGVNVSGMPHAPLMTCISLPRSSGASDMDLDSAYATQSVFSDDGDDYEDDDMSISPTTTLGTTSPVVSPFELFVPSSSTLSGSEACLPTPPDSARQSMSMKPAKSKGAEEYVDTQAGKIMWRIMREPRLSIHSYISDSELRRIAQRL